MGLHLGSNLFKNQGRVFDPIPSFADNATYRATDNSDSTAKGPGLIFDVKNDRYAITSLSAAEIASASAADIAASLATCLYSDIVTVVRAGTVKRQFNSSSVLTQLAANDPPINYVGGIREWQNESTVINQIRNNSMQGGVAGSPGTQPTNWAIGALPGTVARTLGTPTTESGVDVMDFGFAGTGTGNIDIQCELTNVIAAATAQVWAASVFAKIQAGDLTNVTSVNIIISEWTSGGVFLTQTVTAFTPTGTLTRFQTNRTLTDATVAFTTMVVRIVANGAINLTLRLGMPQLERSQAATSPIRTTTASVSRTGDQSTFTAKAQALLTRAAVGVLVQVNGFHGPAGRFLGAGGAQTRGLGTSTSGLAVTLGNTANTVLTTLGSVPSANVGITGTWDSGGPFRGGSYNGAAVVSSAAASIDTTFSSGAYLGGDAGITNGCHGGIRQLVIWPFRVNNADLVAKAVAYT